MRKKRHWHEHGPPWWQGEPGEEWKGWHHEPHLPPEEEWKGWRPEPHLPPWAERRGDGARWHPGARRFLFGFAALFGLFVLLACGLLIVLAAITLLAARQVPLPLDLPRPQGQLFRWVLLLGGAFFLLSLALRRVGTVASRRFAAPLSETMKAADALAEGDLSARVPVAGSPEFRHFARSFNRMAQALETADRQRRELLADVAHELRTPLTVIQGNLEGLRDGVYSATPEHLDLVLDETQKLSRLVDDLRLLTLAEAGQLPLDLQTLDVAQLLADVRDVFAPHADEAGIALVVAALPALPPLRADPQRTGQVLGNLLTNALRHTPSGGSITLGADAAPGGSAVRLWVADTGEGIPAQDLPRIFDRFWRGDPARARDLGGGSGLGLAIARGLVEAQGGRIWPESDGVPGRGTTVSLLLPAAAHAPASQGVVPSPGPRV